MKSSQQQFKDAIDREFGKLGAASGDVDTMMMAQRIKGALKEKKSEQIQGGLADKKRLKDIVLEQQKKPNNEDPIWVRGVGTYDYGTLKDDLIRKTEDILNNIKKDNFNLADHNLEIFVHFYRTLKAYLKNEQPPIATLIKK